MTKITFKTISKRVILLLPMLQLEMTLQISRELGGTLKDDLPELHIVLVLLKEVQVVDDRLEARLQLNLNDDIHGIQNIKFVHQVRSQ